MIDSSGRCITCRQLVPVGTMHTCGGGAWPMTTTWPMSAPAPNPHAQLEALERRVRELERRLFGEPRDE